MGLIITDECINCDVCEPACPNQAIFFDKNYYQINLELCTYCRGFYEEPQCLLLCPIDCIHEV
jgi:ferredoxin